MEKCGDFLTVEINPGAEKGCLFQAHMDTVHEKGVFGEPAVQTCEDRITGPGVIDCKGVSLLRSLPQVITTAPMSCGMPTVSAIPCGTLISP